MSEIARLLRRCRDLAKSERLSTVVAKAVDKILVYAAAPLKRLTFATKSFSYQGKNLRYAVHTYNATWRNERAVEVPIMKDFLSRVPNKRLLEVGNVSAYYGDFKHDVVDKYENTPGVNNVDIMDFKPGQKYDGFMAISTFEHIGWDEPKKDPHKVLDAAYKIYELVSDKENVLVTCPLGYNSALDRYVDEEKLPFKRVTYLKRIDDGNHWVETSKKDALLYKYGSRFPAANSIFIGCGLK